MPTLSVPGTHATIQAAINAATAGDTINVAAGEYRENVSVTKSLTINGAQANNIAYTAGGVVRSGSETIVSGHASNGGNCFSIIANNVTINGFKCVLPNVAAPAQTATIRDAFNIKSPNNATAGTLVERSNITITNNVIISNATSAQRQSLVLGECDANTNQAGKAKMSAVTFSNNFIDFTITSNSACRGIIFNSQYAELTYETVIINNNYIKHTSSSTNSPLGSYYSAANALARPIYYNGLQITSNTISATNSTGIRGLFDLNSTSIINGNTIDAKSGMWINFREAGGQVINNTISTTNIGGVALHIADGTYSNTNGAVATITGNTFNNTNNNRYIQLEISGFNIASVLSSNTFATVPVKSSLAAVPFTKNGQTISTVPVVLFSTIATAIAVVPVGAPIDLYAGTYSGDVDVTKCVTMNGAGSSTIISGKLDITGSGSGAVAPNRLVVSNLKVTNGITIKPASAGSYYTLNTVEATNSGIDINSAAAVTDVQIYASTISNCSAAGVRVSSAVTTLDVCGCTIENNVDGFAIVAGLDISGKNITVHYNNILSNSNKAINHAGTGTLDAIENWFGSADATIVASKINGNVTYIPYIGIVDTPEITVGEDNIVHVDMTNVETASDATDLATQALDLAQSTTGGTDVAILTLILGAIETEDSTISNAIINTVQNRTDGTSISLTPEEIAENFSDIEGASSTNFDLIVADGTGVIELTDAITQYIAIVPGDPYTIDGTTLSVIYNEPVAGGEASMTVDDGNGNLTTYYKGDYITVDNQPFTILKFNSIVLGKVAEKPTGVRAYHQASTIYVVWDQINVSSGVTSYIIKETTGGSEWTVTPTSPGAPLPHRLLITTLDIAQDWTFTVTAVQQIGVDSFESESTTAQYTMDNAPCFPVGTRILTPTGYRTVETLRQGDLVTTAAGLTVPVTVYSRTIKAATKNTAPYVIAAHAFGQNAPATELRLSPLHAFQSRKGVWQIPRFAAAANVNVQQYGIGESVTYYHLECPNFFRDNLVVDGCVVESFAGEQVPKGLIVYTPSRRLGGYTRVSGVPTKKISHC